MFERVLSGDLFFYELYVHTRNGRVMDGYISLYLHK